MVEALPTTPEQDDLGLPKLAVVGKPNVGKSTFINTILGEERNIVTDIAGTTRDSVHTHYQMFGFDFEIVDTAGLRKKKQMADHLEFYSSVRTIKAIDESDVCILMLDGSDPMGRQDLNIFWQVVESYRGVVVVVNKWDLVDKDQNTMAKVEEMIRERTSPFMDIPIVFTSNVKKQRVLKALETALEVRQARASKIPTSELNDLMLPIIDHNPPPAWKGKYVKIKYITQIPSQTPTFAFFCNLPQYIRDPYKRFLENQLREHYDFTGVPIRLFFRKK